MNLTIAQDRSTLYRSMSPSMRDRFTLWADDYLNDKVANRNTGNLHHEETLQRLHQSAREEGFRVGGDLHEFELFCAACGYTIRKGAAERLFIGIDASVVAS